MFPFVCGEASSSLVQPLWLDSAPGQLGCPFVRHTRTSIAVRRKRRRRKRRVRMGTRRTTSPVLSRTAVRRTRGSTGTRRPRTGSSSWSGTTPPSATERTPPHQPPPPRLPSCFRRLCCHRCPPPGSMMYKVILASRSADPPHRQSLPCLVCRPVGSLPCHPPSSRSPGSLLSYVRS